MKDEEMVVEEKALAMVDGFATEMYLRRFGGRLIHKWAAFDNGCTECASTATTSHFFSAGVQEKHKF